jgi:nucleoside-diphosphate-sugar epimerase
MNFTVIGATGYVGSRLVRYFESQHISVFTPQRGDPSLFTRPLGHVLYCAGYTADFRSKMLETVEAHVCFLRDMIAEADFTSLLYLSSTRVYQRSLHADEASYPIVNPQEPGDLYNLSKLMGESLCLTARRPNMRVVRLSNVYGLDMGNENFLGALIEDALTKKTICLQTALSSSKDYIYVDDLLSLLQAIAERGQEKIYNVASGINISHDRILRLLSAATGCTYTIQEHAQEISFPTIPIKKIQTEFSFIPAQFEDILPSIIQVASKNLTASK